MCGIAGFLTPPGQLLRSEALSVAEKMQLALLHRGPDDKGIWLDSDCGIALAHTRLSIQDISHLGHQPMTSGSGDLVISFNGEIYNFLELRKELTALNYQFRGRSDTEVVLAALEEWGLKTALSRFRGMFAFALWDRKKRTLSLARDRVGEKPLYFGTAGKSVVFASELKAIRQFPDFNGEIDRGSLTLFMRYGYIPDPFSIYKNIHKLEPGSYVTFNDAFQSEPSVGTYWDLDQVSASAIEPPNRSMDRVSELDELLQDSVSHQMISDVSIGAFLSGGVDSSAVAAVMQSLSSRPIDTFTIGFEEKEYNEAAFAREVARHIGSNHFETIVSGRDALALVPTLSRVYDEPFSDASQIPTILVSKIARENVKVCLSGDGGDELFCGYNRYRWLNKALRISKLMPNFLRGPSANLVERLADTSFRGHDGRQRNFLSVPLAAKKMHKLASTIRTENPLLGYQALVSGCLEPTAVVHGASEPEYPMSTLTGSGTHMDLLGQVMLWDQKQYLPGDNLVKTDRASMSVGLETRLPLLDHRIIEFSWLSDVQALRLHPSNQSKWLLREVLYRYVPPKLIERPKMGFSVPVASWLKGPLKDWASDLLDPARMDSAGILDSSWVQRAWENLQNDKGDFEHAIWAILMFQSWLTETESDSLGSA